jgi:hypothetical protein
MVPDILVCRSDDRVLMLKNLSKANHPFVK